MSTQKFYGRYIIPIIHKFMLAYWFFARPTSSRAKIIISNRKEILFVKHTYSRHFWSFPGGGIEKGEDPKDAAKRELEEELGIHIEELKFIGTLFSDGEFRKDTIYCYVTRIPEGENIKKDELEIEELLWSSPNNPPKIHSGARKILDLYIKHTEKYN